MTEWPIREVAQYTGLTSRTLRHYEQIGLLAPSRVTHAGYRHYGTAELQRLYQILMLREMGISLSDITRALTTHTEFSAVLHEHQQALEAELHRTQQRITALQHTITAHEHGATMNLTELFASFDPAAHEDEARTRWGDATIDRAQAHDHQRTPAEKQHNNNMTIEINDALRLAAEQNTDPHSPEFQRLITAHHQWVTEQWGGVTPVADAYLGLAEMYVSDPRFAAVYGGPTCAQLVRDAMHAWVAANPTS